MPPLDPTLELIHSTLIDFNYILLNSFFFFAFLFPTWDWIWYKSYSKPKWDCRRLIGTIKWKVLYFTTCTVHFKSKIELNGWTKCWPLAKSLWQDFVSSFTFYNLGIHFPWSWVGIGACTGSKLLKWALRLKLCSLDQKALIKW